MITGSLSRQSTPSQSRTGRIRQLATERELARADADYLRLRQAYLLLGKEKHNDVALAMVGADMERAHAALQSLSGLRRLPSTQQPGPAVNHEARLLEEQDA